MRLDDRLIVMFGIANVLGLVVLAASSTAMAQDFSSPRVLDPDAKLERLWSEGVFTEGGALDSDGSILFSDIGNRLLRFDPTTGEVSVERDPSGRGNGMIFDAEGNLLLCEGADDGGGRRVSITPRDGAPRTLADSFDGKRFNSPNDITLDASGRIYVSDPRYLGDEPRELDVQAVYRIDPDGSVHQLVTTASKPNGLVVSPDQRYLYVSDNGPQRRALIRLNLDEDGQVSNPRVIKTYGQGRGIDGMTITTDGFVVAAAGAGDIAGVTIYQPDGTPIDHIPTPETPTNVEFGGPERDILYITAGTSLYRIATKMTGHHVWPPQGSE